jgi:hypothetical protein
MIDLNNTKTYVILQILLAVFVLLCFRSGIDNFFAGDDFDWLFDTIKMLRNPWFFIEAQNYDLRPTENLYFLANLVLAKGHPLSFHLSAILIHVLNVGLVSLLIAHLCKNRLAGLIGALFWGLNYKHVEAVFRPHATADSLALLGGVGAFLFFVNKRPGWASVALLFGLFAKENALVFPLLFTLYVVWFVSENKKQWAIRTIPSWIVALIVAGLVKFVRSGDPAYLTIDLNAFSRFWELMLTYVGPDVVFTKQVWLHGQAYVFSWWLAGILCILLGLALWKFPVIYRFGVLWMIIATIPTLFIVYQTSRYYYVPLVGLGIIIGQGGNTLLNYFQQRHARRAIMALSGGFLLLMMYFVAGVHLEERDYDMYGEVHREVIESFTEEIFPSMPKDEQSMAVLLYPETRKWEEVLYAQYLLKPWFFPKTYKWVYARPFGMLGGLATPYGLMSYGSYCQGESSLFVGVSYEMFRQHVLAGDFYVIVHDYDTNTLNFGNETLKAEVAKRVDDRYFYHFFQPGHFDPTYTGEAYL